MNSAVYVFNALNYQRYFLWRSGKAKTFFQSEKVRFSEILRMSWNFVNSFINKSLMHLSRAIKKHSAVVCLFVTSGGKERGRWQRISFAVREGRSNAISTCHCLGHRPILETSLFVPQIAARHFTHCRLYV